MNDFFIYIDGICKGNPGKGGFAYMIYDEVDVVWYDGHGKYEDTTNNQMELFAAIEALRVLNANKAPFKKITIFSNSAYVVNCFKEDWISRWEKNGWKTHKGEDVVNKSFWLVLNKIVTKMSVKFERVKKTDVKIKKVNEKSKWI